MKSTLKKRAHHHQVKLMGCGFIITAIHEDPKVAWDAIRSAQTEIQRIEDLISSWKNNSETALINNNAGIKSIEVSSELFQLIRRSLRISTLTGGAFDISGTLSRYYWDFNKNEINIPDQQKIEELRDRIDYRLIELDERNNSVFLKKEGMKIGFGGIGKGYSALMAQKKMMEIGIEDGLIDASGDIMCWGNPLGQENWTINLTNPEKIEERILEVQLNKGSVVTSGDYENYLMISGKKYSHIVDPRTGWPVDHLKSVSVICPNPELGDALATAISVLGYEAGLRMINRLEGIECMMVGMENDIYYSNGLNLN
jgi:thiamine biosynthesis lipoprotein